MRIQNDALAKHGGIKVQNLLSPLAAANGVIVPDSPTGLAVDIEEDRKMNGILSWGKRGLSLNIFFLPYHGELASTGRWCKWQ